MSIVALSTAPPPSKWLPERLRIEQHEWGVAVNVKADRTCRQGRVIQRWINDQRSRGHGLVMTFHCLRLRVAWRTFDELPRHNDPRWDVVDQFLCDVLNNPRSGLVLVPLDRCTTCG
ncbi:hypothetical protein AB0H57_05505 [Micromonospora sp. NPDC050686]|uniref:hypothetical protein n=1 Tax=Micromonospora sp. NPDC050686 TaxID=3154631 RepID=UPI0033D643AA